MNMTRQGADATSTSVSELQSLGATFVCRYLSETQNTWKNLTASEASTLQAAGIDIVSNWEEDTNDWQGGQSQGVNFAQQAQAMHSACGGPAGAPIYFSVDMDADPTSVVNSGYFQGINSVLGVDRTGAYAGTAVLEALKSAGLITYTWRTMSTDFQGGAGTTGEFNLTQDGEYNSDYDKDTAWTDDFGQWSAHTTPTAPESPQPPSGSGPNYEYNATHNTQTPISVDGDFGPDSWKALQFVLGVTCDGDPGPITVTALQVMLAVSGSPAVAIPQTGVLDTTTVEAFQEKVGTTQDGSWGPITSTAAQNMLNAGTLYGSN